MDSETWDGGVGEGEGWIEWETELLLLLLLEGHRWWWRNRQHPLKTQSALSSVSRWFHSIQIHRIKSFKFIQTKLATSSLLLSILFLFFSSSANSAKLKSLPTNNLLALIQLPFFIRISRISKLKFEFMGSQQGISSSRQLLRTSPTSHSMFQSSNPSKSLTDPLLFLASDVGSTVN